MKCLGSIHIVYIQYLYSIYTVSTVEVGKSRLKSARSRYKIGSGSVQGRLEVGKKFGKKEYLFYIR